MITKTAITPETGKSAAMTSLQGSEPVKLRRRIGSTSYTLTIKFSVTATESAEDKILRLVEREVSLSA